MARASYQNRIELLQGTLDMLVLRTLQWGAQHGHGIGVAIAASSEDALLVDSGSLYPALHRMEEARWIKARWTTTERNRRVRTYEITAAGQRQLDLEEARWRTITAAVAHVLKHA